MSDLFLYLLRSGVVPRRFLRVLPAFSDEGYVFRAQPRLPDGIGRPFARPPPRPGPFAVHQDRHLLAVSRPAGRRRRQPRRPIGARHGPADVLLAVYAAGAGLFLLLFLVRSGASPIWPAERMRASSRPEGRPLRPGRRALLLLQFHLPQQGTSAAGDLDRILAHEQVHIRQLHSFDVLLMEILTVIFNGSILLYGHTKNRCRKPTSTWPTGSHCAGLQARSGTSCSCSSSTWADVCSSWRAASGHPKSKGELRRYRKQETKGLARWKPLYTSTGPGIHPGLCRVANRRRPGPPGGPGSRPGCARGRARARGPS